METGRFLFFHNFEFFGLRVAGDVGQKLSKAPRNCECRISNGVCCGRTSYAVGKPPKDRNRPKTDKRGQKRTAKHELSVVSGQLSVALG